MGIEEEWLAGVDAVAGAAQSVPVLGSLAYRPTTRSRRLLLHAILDGDRPHLSSYAEERTKHAQSGEQRLAPVLDQLTELINTIAMLPLPTELDGTIATWRGWEICRSVLLDQLVNHDDAAEPAAVSFLRQLASSSAVTPSVMLTQWRDDAEAACLRLFEATSAEGFLGVFARAVGDLGAASTDNTRPNPTAWAEDAASWTALAHARLRQSLSTGDLFNAGSMGVELAREAAHRLPDSSAAASNVISGAVTDEADAQARLAVADAIRGLLFVFAVGQRVAVLAHLGQTSTFAQRWRNAASLPLEEPEDLTPISDLIRQTADGSGLTVSQVTVMGVVDRVEITHQDGVPVSQLWIRDPDTLAVDQAGETGEATAHEVLCAVRHLKVDSGGAVAGAVVRLTGTWDPSVKWLDSGSALIVSRLVDGDPLSWESFLRNELRHIYRPATNGLQVLASWEPGHDGAVNPLKYGVVADDIETAELPYARSK